MRGTDDARAERELREMRELRELQELKGNTASQDVRRQIPYAPEDEDLINRVKVERRRVAVATDALDETSYLSWLWIFLFGPIYFAWHGLWRAFVISIIAAIPVTFVPPLILLYWPGMMIVGHIAWKSRTRKEVERVLSRPRY